MNKIWKYLIATAIFCSFNPANGQNRIITNDALDELILRGKTYCETVKDQGAENSIKFSAKIETNFLVSFFKGLAATVILGVDTTQKEWKNVLQKDLANLKSQESDCRIEYLKLVLASVQNVPTTLSGSEVIEIKPSHWKKAPEEERGVALDRHHRIFFPDSQFGKGIPFVSVDIVFPLVKENLDKASYHHVKEPITVTDKFFTVMLIKGDHKETQEFARVDWKAIWIENKD